MKAKKIPYYLLLILLTIGASLILGFLSFGGMFVLWPIVSLALGAFVLSVAYEGEIYLQNIKGALNKLFFKHDYLKHHLSNEYLLTHFPDTSDENCPEFFKDYEKQLKLLASFQHKRLDASSLANKKKIEKTLRNMEKWFALQLFSDKKNAKVSKYEEAVMLWLIKGNEQENWKLKLANRKATYNLVKVFSTVAGLFMGFGTTYLLVEAFSVIPILASISFTMLPFFIVPMAVVAGAAYGFLTYNAVTDMINNDTFNKWAKKIREDLSKGLTFRTVFIAVTAALLLSLAVALTICTAGTWWTVVKNTPPLFTWVGKIPGFVMGIIHPIVTGLSSLVFNLQNTSESLEMIYEATKIKSGFLKRISQSIADGWSHLRSKENWLQILNPARILIKLTYTPLRILFFFGHLVSIGVTADRVPGIPQILSTLLGIISEGFEDMHYFFSHGHESHHHEDDFEMKSQHASKEKKSGHKQEHTKALLKEHFESGHGHNHDVDIPSRLLKGLFTPIYALAAAWDAWASKRNEEGSRNVLNFSQAWEKQIGLQAISTVPINKQKLPSNHWQAEHAVLRIERFKEKHLAKVIWNKDIAAQKVASLTALQQELRENEVDVMGRIDEEKTKQIYHKQRFFAKEDKTQTENFLEDLSSKIASPAA